MIAAELHLHKTIALRGLNPRLYRYNKINVLAISRNWSLIATASGDGTARLWKMATGEPVKVFHSHTPYRAKTVAISPDNRIMVSAGDNDAVRIWDIARGSEIYTITIPNDSEEFGCFVNDLNFSPDGALLAVAGSGSDNVRLWEVGTWSLRWTFSGHRDIVWNAIFSPDSKLLASCSVDKTIKLWDITAGREIVSLEGHRESVPAIAFSNNGKRLASGSTDDSIKIWDLDTMREIVHLNSHPYLATVAFLYNDFLLVSCSTDGHLKLWDIARSQELQSVGCRLYCVPSIAVSPDGRAFTLAYGNGVVEQWHILEK